MPWHSYKTVTRLLFSGLIAGIFLQGQLFAAPASYTVDFGQGRTKSYHVIPCHAVPSTQIVYINFQDDLEAIQYTLDTLLQKTIQTPDVVVIIGDKATILGAFLAQQKKIPWIVLTTKKPFSPVHECSSYFSITRGSKKLYLTHQQAQRIKGKRVIILDDVLSTGETMKAAIRLIRNAKADIQSLVVGFTEGTPRTHLFFEGKKYGIIKVGHLPTFTH